MLFWFIEMCYRNKSLKYWCLIYFCYFFKRGILFGGGGILLIVSDVYILIYDILIYVVIWFLVIGNVVLDIKGKLFWVFKLVYGLDNSWKMIWIF